MMHRLGVACAALAVSALAAGSAAAGYIGVPVDGFGSSTVVGSSNTSSNGRVRFFIPLNNPVMGENVFGVSGIDGANTGLVSDSCADFSLSMTPCTGSLQMFMKFNVDAGDTPGIGTLKLSFIDLDLLGVNDPQEPEFTFDFVESIEFLNEGGASSILITNIMDSIPNVTVTGDRNSQLITISNLPIDDTPHWVKFTFTSEVQDAPGKVRNTKEKLLAKLWVEPVPEPGALSLVAFGMFGLGVAAYRRRRPNPKAEPII